MYVEDGKLIVEKEDTFQANLNMGAIIADFVRKYKEEAVHIHGVPYSLMQAYNFTCEERLTEKWLFVLDEIIQAFDPEHAPKEEEYHLPSGEFDMEEYKIAWGVHASRQARGMRLFSRHFKDLWW